MDESFEIKPAKFADLDFLNNYLFVNIPHFHEDKIGEQENGEGVWLIAWKNNIPVGHLQVRWAGSKIDKVRKTINNCPHIESVGVSEKFRRQGIGTHLTLFALRLAKEKGYRQVGLAVGKNDNPYAKEMYEKLGFEDWEKGEIIDSWKIINNQGKEDIESEICTYLIKKLD